PTMIIAAWWGRHYCNPTTGVKTMALGTAPNRIFIIEWAECSMLNTGNNQGTDYNFETQLWLYEGSNVVRAHYGPTLHTANNLWPDLGWGMKGPTGKGFQGPGIGGETICTPSPALPEERRCVAADFPRNSVIQYGLTPGADLAGRVKPGTLTVDATTFEL